MVSAPSTPDKEGRDAGSPPRHAAFLRLNMTFGLAAAIALGMSLEFLFQSFVWRNWPVAAVLEGWLYILRDRLIVAALIAAAITGLRILQVPSLRLRTVLLASCVLCCAVLGEAVVGLLHGGNLPVPTLLAHSLRWCAISLSAAASYYLWCNAQEARGRLQREALQRQQLEQQVTNMRLTVLRKQIEPHFLFNTLATVRRLQRVEPSMGAHMLANFVDYLRGLLPMLASIEVPLGEELALVQAYLEVIRVRMGERLHATIAVPAELNRARVPPLAVATLVENAIKHGLAPSPTGGRLDITANTAHGMLTISVTDTGVGLKSDLQCGSGIGLYNIRSRLATLHGGHASLRIHTNRPAGVRASIQLPLRHEAR